MKLVIGEGKTTALIKESAETGFYIVCMSQEECSRIFHLAQRMKLDIPFPLSFSEFIQGQYYAPGIKGFLIDNADYLLQHLSKVPIKTITIAEVE